MKTVLASSMLVLSTVSVSAAAEDFSWGNVDFQPRAYVGYADYELKSGTFNIDLTFPDGSQASGTGPATIDFFGRNKLQFSGLIWGVGGTVASGQFFSDLYYQSTADITAYSGTEQIIDSSFSQNLSDVNAQHADWAISLGYRITDQWSVFAGYKYGKTEWDQTFRQNALPPDSSLLANGSVDGEFKQDGPFIGTAYSFVIGPGALTFKAAYAYLDGTYTWNSPEVIYTSEGPVADTLLWKLNGNSNAYSLGVSWTQSLTNNLGVSVGANYHNYRFDMSGTANAALEGNTPIYSGQVSGGTLTEELFTLTASLLYTF